MPPQNSSPNPDQYPLQSSGGQPLQPVPTPLPADPTPRPEPTVQTSQHGNVEINHAPGQMPQYGYQAAQPLQPLPHQPADQHQAYPGAKPADAAADPYAFFLDAKAAPKKPLLQGLPKTNSKLSRIIIVAVIAVIALMITAVIISALGNKDTGEAGGTLTAVVNDQQEIVRVSTLAQPVIQSSSLKNFTVTALSTVTSEQQSLITYANGRGAKIDTKALAKVAGDTRIDASLTAAQAAGTYDSTYQSAMGQLLTDYQNDLKTVRSSSSSAATQNLLGKQADDADLLHTMLLAQ